MLLFWLLLDCCRFSSEWERVRFKRPPETHIFTLRKPQQQQQQGEGWNGTEDDVIVVATFGTVCARLLSSVQLRDGNDLGTES